MATTTKVQARILTALETHATMREAVTAAAWQALTEARSLGWSARTQAGIVQAFANVAADMVAECIAVQA